MDNISLLGSQYQISPLNIWIFYTVYNTSSKVNKKQSKNIKYWVKIRFLHKFKFELLNKSFL